MTEGRAVILVAVLLLVCSNGPPYMTLGDVESYCVAAEDCQPGLFCLAVDEARYCTPACASDADCGTAHACSRTEGICRPVREGTCRAPDRRCGPSFDPCCSGSVCVEFPPFGAYCTRERCNEDFDCASGCCAPVSGGGRICAPPSYC